TIWLLAGVNVGGIPETMTVALVRARCCEMLGEYLAGEDMGGEYFLLGLCSLLDVMLDQPMEQALAELPLADEIRSALMGGENTAGSVLEAVTAYERGRWDAAIASAESVGLPSSLLPNAYGEALKWSKALWVDSVRS